MNQTSLSFTVFFEDPFWIGLFEYREQQLLYLKRIVFGSEPSEQVVYEWLKGCWYSISFQAPVETVQREARKAQDTGLSLTKSQLAVKQQQEERAELKAERRKENREGQKEAFRLRQMKKKAKHKGR